MTPLAIAGALAVGLSLGLTGAGGSILTLPILVYLAGLAPEQAVGPSLFVVGTAAAAGAIPRWKNGDFHPRAALMFAGAGVPGAWIGAKFTMLVPAPVLMSGFAVIMLAVAFHMLLSGDEATGMLPECRPLRCLAAGTGTGLLTGFLGVGGGFLLVPALVKFARLPVRTASGTSLGVISLNSTAGFLSHASHGPTNGQIAGLFAALAITGSLAGTRLGRRLPTLRLKQGFAILVLLSGGWVVWQNLAL